MQVILIQSEIEDALRFYLNSRGLVVEGKAVSIEMSATRGEKGFTANLSITDALETVEPAPVPTTSIKRGLGVANKVTAARTAPAANTATEEPAQPIEDEGKPPFDTDAEEPAEPAAEPEAEAAPAKPSIFANLKKPTNNSDAAAA